MASPSRAVVDGEASASADKDLPNTASSTSSWVILAKVARVSPTTDDADLSLALETPPRISLLVIPPRMFPLPVAFHHFPSVVATDPSGLLLLHADQGPASGRIYIAPPPPPNHLPRAFVPAYFVLDAAAATAFPLPNPEFIRYEGHLGLLASPKGDGHYMVAELQSISAHRAIVLCFASEIGEWVVKNVRYPLTYRTLAPHGVVSHAGKLWWVDLSWCLIACDPSAEAPVLRFVPLPPGMHLMECSEEWGMLPKRRCVGVSGGKLRFVDMYEGSSAVPQVSVWTLADVDAEEWTLEHETSFMNIFNHDSYKAADLPSEVPDLALIHPDKPCILYFYHHTRMFGVDVTSHEVVGCDVNTTVAPPSSHMANTYVHAWQVPHALSAGLLSKDTGSGSSEESASPASTASGVSQEALSQINLEGA